MLKLLVFKMFNLLIPSLKSFFLPGYLTKKFILDIISQTRYLVLTNRPLLYTIKIYFNDTPWFLWVFFIFIFSSISK